VKGFSDTVEDLAGHEHAMAGEDGRGVGERVGVEGGAAGDEPPGLDEAGRSVDPGGRGDDGLGGEQLGNAGQRGVEAGIAR
jgi:hypothetical protein